MSAAEEIRGYTVVDMKGVKATMKLVEELDSHKVKLVLLLSIGYYFECTPQIAAQVQQVLGEEATVQEENSIGLGVLVEDE